MRRVSELVRMHLAEILQTQMRDPRLEGVTITQVVVTPDTQRADVYFSVLGGEEERQAAEQGLESAGGLLRRELGSRTRLRNTPELVFIWDSSLEHADRMEELFDQLGLGQEDDDDRT